MQQLTAAELNELDKTNVLITFTQPGCAPCRQLKRVLEAVESKHPARTFVVVDVQQSPELIDEYNLAGTPTTFVSTENGFISFRGVKSVAELNELLAS
jgi:thiol-disulfide isomerase/thioredoxin